MAVMRRPSTLATTSPGAAPVMLVGDRNSGTYKKMNAATTMNRLHLSQDLCRRIRSSMVIERDLLLLTKKALCHAARRQAGARPRGARDHIFDIGSDDDFR